MRLFFAFLLFLWVSAAQASVIEMQSDTGDWIGGGKNFSLTDNFSVHITQNRIYISQTDGYSFEFLPPNNTDFKTGAYRSAQRAAFKAPTNPGLDVSSLGRGCNTLSGEFFIHELEPATLTSPLKLALDFVQFCESGSSALRGQIRINSNIAIPAPFPIAIAQAEPANPKEGGQLTLFAGASFSSVSSIKSYQWEQVSGLPVVLSDPHYVAPTVQLPTDMNLGGEDIVLKLTVTDAVGQAASTTLPVHIASKSDPETYVKLESQAGDYIGQGKNWLFDNTNSTITASKNYGNGISVSIAGDSRWSADFAASSDSQLQLGQYDNAERFPFQTAGSAGLDFSGDGRGCNMLNGSFNISTLVWDSGHPVSFKADFEQHCEMGIPALKGSIAVNAVPDNVPIADAGADIQVYEKQPVNLNGSGSYDKEGQLAHILWTVDSTGLPINNATETRANFVAPALKNRETSRTLLASLLVVDDQGYKAMDTVRIKVLANNQAPTATPDTVTLPYGGSTEILPLLNDTDSDGQLQIDSINIIKAPGHGTVIARSNGSILYTHTGTFAGLDSLTYTVTDNDGVASSPATINITITPKEDIAPLSLNLRTFLQGAYETHTGMMRDSLRTLGLLPLAQPYNTSTLAYDGSETTTVDVLATEGNDAPVDWVIVELRNPTNPAIVVARQAALLQRDGDVADPHNNTTPLLIKGIPAGQYYVAIRHRNHLPVMSATPLMLDNTVKSLDFTQTSTLIAGTHGRLDSGTGISLQWAGDANLSGSIIASGPNNDVLPILSNILMQADNTLANSNFLLKGYYPTDLNLDGMTVFAGAKNDIDLLLGNVLLHPDNTHFASNYIIRDVLSYP